MLKLLGCGALNRVQHNKGTASFSSLKFIVSLIINDLR